MIILGLHFGHDSSISVLKNGIECVNLVRERHNRAKHSFGINVSHIEAALMDACLEVSDIDFFALTSTQPYEYIVVDQPSNLEINFGMPKDHIFRSTMYDNIKPNDPKFTRRLAKDLILNYVYSDKGFHHKNMFPEHKQIRRDQLGITPALRDFQDLAWWLKGNSLEDIGNLDISKIIETPHLYNTLRNLFHYPMTIKFHGRCIPAIAVQHHAAHASSSYYSSGTNKAAVLTHDGGFYQIGQLNGMIFFGNNNHLLPITPNHLNMGDFYELIGVWLGFDLAGAAGKLMGLAPYGKSIFFERKFVGNIYDHKKSGINNFVNEWKNHCLKSAQSKQYDLTAIGNTNRILDPICVDIAASTQKLFEETILSAVKSTYHLFSNSKVDLSTLCYSGGTALNCPTNTRLHNDSPFEKIHIPPTCDDSGLSTGAAKYLYYNVLGKKRSEGSKSKKFSTPYLGIKYQSGKLIKRLKKEKQNLFFEVLANSEKFAAIDLHENKIVAWFESRSEVGPRALGHRSLFANPKFRDNWKKMNELKIREKWRPFAPAVLEEDVGKYFTGIPTESPFMLFTAQVKTKELPAITHVDNTARVQTVTERTGGLFNILKYFKHLSGISVLLNTSFNGPREPIIERPEEAIQFLLSHNLDVLYIDKVRVTKKV